MAPVCTDRLPDVAARGTRGDRACVDRSARPMAGAGSKRQGQSQLPLSGWPTLAPRDPTPPGISRAHPALAASEIEQGVNC